MVQIRLWAFLIRGWSFSILLGLSLPASAELVIQNELDAQSLLPHVEVIEDASGRATFDQVRRYSESLSFPRRADANLPKTQGAYWFRFNIRSELTRELDWVVGFTSVDFTRIDYYERLPKGEVLHLASGHEIAPEHRPINSRYFGFPLSLKPNKSKEIWIRTQSRFPILHPLTLWDKDAFIRHEKKSDFILMAYFGALVALFLYNLSLGTALHSRIHFSYLIWLASLGLLLFIGTGFAGYYFVSYKDWPKLTGPLRILVLFAALLFSQSYLARSIPRSLSRAYTLAIFACGVLLVMALTPLFDQAMSLYNIATLIAVILFTSSAIIASKRSWASVRYYVLSWVGIYIAALAYLAKAFGVSKALTPDPLWAVVFGSFFEMILLSLALADRLYQKERVAKELAEAASKEKSRFVADLSHEIRTPLGAIAGFADLLQDPKIDDYDRTRFIEVIHRNSLRLKHLIGDILDLSKVEVGRMDIEKKSFSIRELFREVIHLLSIHAQEKGVKFSLQVSPEVPDLIFSDEMKLRQILINMIGNSIKFTDHGEVSVRVQKSTNPHPFLEVRITDTGIGIAPEHQIRLFKPFMQANETIYKQFGGTGLGLSLSRKLAQVLGGDITLLWAAPGEGSQFLLSLPLHEPTSDQPQKILVKASDPRLDHLKILLVEDSVDNQMLITRMLKKWGAHIECASDGKSGVERAWQSSFHIILMDMQMPIMDGYTATRELRSNGFEAPILAVTAHATPEDRSLCLQCGCNDYLSKPIDFTRLLEKILALTQSPPFITQTSVRSASAPTTSPFRTQGPEEVGLS